MQTSENCTYFESQGTESGSCSATVCPVSSNICQMRLDFNMFSLSGPDAGTTSTLRILNGSPAKSTNAPQARPATQCTIDSFTVLSNNGRSPAPICGVNSNEHCKFLNKNDWEPLHHVNFVYNLPSLSIHWCQSVLQPVVFLSRQWGNCDQDLEHQGHTVLMWLSKPSSRWLWPVVLWGDNRKCAHLQLWLGKRLPFGIPRPKHLCQVELLVTIWLINGMSSH